MDITVRKELEIIKFSVAQSELTINQLMVHFQARMDARTVLKHTFVHVLE